MRVARLETVARLLAPLTLAGSAGLEIGPLTDPLVFKDEADVLYVDHADHASLVAKYAAEAGVDTAAIVPVDVVWPGGDLRPRLPEGRAPEDFVLASHVIEHVPNLVGWLRRVADVLRPGGMLGLAVPDRRFSFDLPRAETRLCDLIDAFIRDSDRPTPGQIFDYVAGVAEVDVAAAWRGALPPEGPRHYASPANALVLARRGLPTEPYMDVHCWVFTPRGWLQRMAELADLGLLDFACESFHDTERGSIEFLTGLRRLPDDAPPGAAAASFRAALAALLA